MNDQIQAIKQNLAKFVSAIDDFYLTFEGKILKENAEISTYGISSLDISLILMPKIYLTIEFLSMKKSFGINTSSQTTDLEQFIRNKFQLDRDTDLTLLVFIQDKMVSRVGDGLLIDFLDFSDETNLPKISVKLTKCLMIKDLIRRQKFMFKGLRDCIISEQKALFCIDYKIPIEHQAWSIEGENGHIMLEDAMIVEEKDFSNETVTVLQVYTLQLCIDSESYTLKNALSIDLIRDLKVQASQILGLQAEFQTWIYETFEFINEKTFGEHNLPEGKNVLAIDVLIQKDLEYFGFSEKSMIKVDTFKDFYLQSDEQLHEIITMTDFNKREDEKRFRDKILGVFFAILKKHSLCEDFIQTVSYLAFQKKAINLWKSENCSIANDSKFNTQYLLYYILNCGDLELNSAVLDLIRHHYPIPLSINTFESRFQVTGTKFLEEVGWLLNSAYTITSIGLQDINKEERSFGKSTLLNKIFATNFQEIKNKNNICKGCPEIMIDLYKSDKFPINLIDIPSNADHAFKEKIMLHSNLVIIQSLANVEYAKDFAKKLIDKRIPVIILHRDKRGAFKNIGAFKNTLVEAVRCSSQSKILEFSIDHIQQGNREHEMNLISEEIHLFIKKEFSSEVADHTQFLKLYNQQDQVFLDILFKIEMKKGNLCNAVDIFYKQKAVEKSEDLNPVDKKKLLKDLET